MEESNKIIRDIAEQEYKYGFTTDIDTEAIPRGLDEEVVRLISVSYTHLTLPTN